MPERLAEAIFRRSLQGSRNVNFVGGNPDQHAHTILMVMKASSVNLPMVWNSNMYHSKELAEIIEDVVDVFLADFRYGNNTCAKRLSNVNNYWEVVTRNFKSAYENSEMIIRHLILPGHLECCSEPILRWIADNLGQSVRFNLMFQYYPTYKAYEYPDISRRLTYEEKKRSIELVERYGLINVIR
jgi:putative pyruvate formate lyase activating enzyme